MESDTSAIDILVRILAQLPDIMDNLPPRWRTAVEMALFVAAFMLFIGLIFLAYATFAVAYHGALEAVVLLYRWIVQRIFGRRPD